MDDIKNQKHFLEKIYSDALHAPVFKSNSKFCIEQFARLTPYIAFGDVMNNKFIIRGTNDYNNKSESNPILVEYNSMDELLEDGWRLD